MPTGLVEDRLCGQRAALRRLRMDTLVSVLEQIGWQELATRGIRVLLILLAAWIGHALLRVSLRRLEARLLEQNGGAGPDKLSEGGKRTGTLMRLLRQAAYATVWAVALLTILPQLGVDIAPILASAGIAGLAIGFGAQNLVRDIISGIFLIFEDQVRVDDWATVNGTTGLVEAVNLRTLVLRDNSGVVHVIRNGAINSLSNATKEWSAYLMDIGVAYKEDTDRVVAIMEQVAEELRADPERGPDILEPLEVFGVNKFADSAVEIRARLKTRPGQQWLVGRAYLRRLKQAFDAAGVEIPFPHRTLYFGAASPPVAAQLIPTDARPAGDVRI